MPRDHDVDGRGRGGSDGSCGTGTRRARHSHGLDHDVWNPATDVNLVRRFNLRTLDRRPANKRALQARLGLPQRDDVPLVAMVTRLDAQKGLGITGHIVHLLMNNAAAKRSFVLAGSGASRVPRRCSGIWPAIIARRWRPCCATTGHWLRSSTPAATCSSCRRCSSRAGSVSSSRCATGRCRSRGPPWSRRHRPRRGHRLHVLRLRRLRLLEALRRALYIWHHDHGSWRPCSWPACDGLVVAESARSYQQLYEWGMASAR